MSKFIKNIILNVKKALFPIYKTFIGRVVMTEGSLKDRDETIRVLYVYDQHTRDYLEDLAFEETPTVIFDEVVFVWKIKKAIQKHSPDIAIAYIHDRWSYLLNGLEYYRSPNRVNQIIDVSGSWEEVKSRFCRARKTFSNQVQSKYGFDYRISNHSKDFDVFYNEFFVPYITRRFEPKYLWLDSYENLKDVFERGFLLFVTRNGEDVAAALCDVQQKTLKQWRLGWKVDQSGNIDPASGNALYYFTLTLAMEKKFTVVDVTSSQSFFNDGVYKNKKRWGASIQYYLPEHYAEYEYIPYYINSKSSDTAIAFFSENPFIYMKDGKFFGLIGWENEEFPCQNELHKLKKKYYSEGLAGLTIINNIKNGQYEYLFE